VKTSIPKIINVRFKPFTVIKPAEYKSEEIKPLILDALDEASAEQYDGIIIALYDSQTGGVYSSALFKSQSDFLRCLEIAKHRHIK
jgi:hypothetical protein